MLSETLFWLRNWLVAAVLLDGAVLLGGILLIQSDIDFETFLTLLALGLLVLVVISLFHGVLATHDQLMQTSHEGFSPTASRASRRPFEPCPVVPQAVPLVVARAFAGSRCGNVNAAFASAGRPASGGRLLDDQGGLQPACFRNGVPRTD